MTTSSFPNNDRQIELKSGNIIRFYELIVLDAGDARSFSVHYDTKISAEDRQSRLSEAAEVIDYFADRAGDQGVIEANASICSTPAQAATTELPEEIYRFRPSDDGSWSFIGTADLPARPYNTRGS